MSGDRLVNRGSFLGTGADLDVLVPGFRPKSVIVRNEGGLAKLEWHESMADDSGFKTVTDGTMSFITTNGITPKNQGFSLGADADVNVSGEKCYYEAEE